MSKKEIFTLDNKEIYDLVIYRDKNSIYSELEGETVILDIASGVYSGLDSVGTFLWGQLEQPLSLAELRKRVMQEYEVLEDECLSDLLVFLAQMYEAGLISIKEVS